jgi:hypothetical protein
MLVYAARTRHKGDVRLGFVFYLRVLIHTHEPSKVRTDGWMEGPNTAIAIIWCPFCKHVFPVVLGGAQSHGPFCAPF